MNKIEKLVISFILFGFLFSSCGVPKQLTSYDESYLEEQKYAHQPIVISEFKSFNLVKRDHNKIAVLSYPASASLFSLTSLASGAGLASSLLAGLYFSLPVPIITGLILAQEGGKTKQYRESLDKLSLAEIEGVLINSPDFLYQPESPSLETDSLYKLNLRLNYSHVNSGSSRNKVDNPQLRIYWHIMSPEGNIVASITTANQFLSNEPPKVKPRNPDFKDAYIELAKQSAESFLSILNGIPGTNIPTDPYAHKKRTDANIISSEYIGTKRNRPSSKQQYFVVINKGLEAGYQENKTYDVVKNKGINGEGSFNLDKPVWERQKMMRIARIDVTKSEDNYAEGTITLLRGQNKPEDYDFSNELVRLYWAY